MNKLSASKQIVIVGLSGGVDSAVSAYLLKKQGYQVIGLFMQNWDSYANNDFAGHDSKSLKCDPQKDFEDAAKVALALDIPIHRVQFIEQYWNKVFQEALSFYQKGLVPNPDVWCNKQIKFASFWDYAKKHLHANLMAFGHYAKVDKSQKPIRLLIPKDANKDQTYFLCQLTQQQLANSLFPLENLTKQEVRDIAKKLNLPIWNKKDSTGICFIGERKFKAFLGNYLSNKPGDIVDITTNKVIGKHDGIIFYTIGQNKGLNLGGQKTKYFVCKKDLQKNILYVVDQKHQSRYLSSTSCEVSDFSWISKPTSKQAMFVRFRHRGPLIPVKIRKEEANNLIITYQATLSVCPGQFAVLYQDNCCLGGGIISKIITN